MYDRLKIPNFIMKSEKYIFKKKLILKSKSKRRLFTEATFMFILSLSLIYIIYLIPNKNLLLQNLPSTFDKSYVLINDLFFNLFQIFLVLFIFISAFVSLFLFIGSFYRLFRVTARRSKQITYK